MTLNLLGSLTNSTHQIFSHYMDDLFPVLKEQIDSHEVSPVKCKLALDFPFIFVLFNKQSVRHITIIRTYLGDLAHP